MLGRKEPSLLSNQSLRRRSGLLRWVARLGDDIGRTEVVPFPVVFWAR